MNQTEFAKWIDRAVMLFDEVRRFADSRGDQKRELFAEWFAILAETSAVDANTVLTMLASGDLVRPEYFDVGRLAGLVMREARALASNRSRRLQYGEPQTYRCATCRDSGLVNVWNPRFVENYRAQFATVTRTPIDRDEKRTCEHGRLRFDMDRFDPDRTIVVYRYEPVDWLQQAVRWWRLNVGPECGPLHHVVRCVCDGERSRLLLAEREKFVKHERRLGTKDLGMPVCGMADYNARVMPLKTDEPFDDLANWYAEHEVNDVYEWTPNPADYARF